MCAKDKQGMTLFNLNGAGVLELNRIETHSGGIIVDAGGVKVHSGGMEVKGGLTVTNGGVNLPSQAFTVGQLHVEGTSNPSSSSSTRGSGAPLMTLR